MQLGYFTDSAYDMLHGNIEANLDRYYSEEEWLEDSFQGTEYYKVSSISVDKFTPYIDSGEKTNDRINEEDRQNVKRLFDAFKSLTPWQATNKFMWTYLCHAVPEYSSYIRHRWLVEPKASTVETRFFVTNSSSVRNDNALARLWWYGYFTYEEGAANPYELTDILLVNQTVCSDVVDTLNRTNRNRIRGVLLAIRDFLDVQGSTSGITDQVRHLNRYLNRYAAVTRMDMLSAEEVRDIAFKRLIAGQGQ